MIELIWIDEQIALAIHERLLSLHGGASGGRDKELLKSALARPLNLLAMVTDLLPLRKTLRRQ